MGNVALLGHLMHGRAICRLVIFAVMDGIVETCTLMNSFGPCVQLSEIARDFLSGAVTCMSRGHELRSTLYYSIDQPTFSQRSGIIVSVMGLRDLL